MRKHLNSMRICRALFLSFIIAAIFIICTSISGKIFAYPLYESKSFENIHAAVAAPGHSKAVILVTGRHRISSNLLIPDNISLRFKQGGIFVVDSGVTVTIDSPVQAPLGRIFDGKGAIVLKPSEVFPHWWGARGDGNHDDGYAIQAAIDAVHAGGGGIVRLPAGTYLLNHITGAYYALKSKNKVSVIGDGRASILKVGDHLRTPTRGVAVLYNHEDLVSQCRYEHFTVDYNGKANLRLSAWGDARVSNVSRMGAEFASDVTIDDIHFKEVTGAHCVWIGIHPSNQRNIVRNCLVSNVGQSVHGNQLADHSSIFIGGNNGIVSGNVFHNETPCNISTAIEIHSSNTVVSNNVATNYSTALNIGGVASDCSNVAITNNIFKNCRNGIVLWHYAHFALNNITISDNTLSIRESDAAVHPPSMGIIYGSGYVTSEMNMSGLKISGNTLSQETVTIPSRHPHTAIHLESIDLVTITGNTIYNFNGEAIYMQSRSPKQGIGGAVISGNNIKNVGLTSNQNRKRAVVFNSYQTSSGSIRDIHVKNNSISGGEQSPMANGIAFNNGFFNNVDISGNTILNTSSYEILNNSTGSNPGFHIDQAGNGPPANTLRASDGSRWVDRTTGRVYIYRGAYGKGRWQ